MKNQDRNYVTEDNTGGYFLCHCECGHMFSSGSADGGHAIADTGDYEDIICPKCGNIDPPEADNINIAWNFQQRKIDALKREIEMLKGNDNVG